MSIWNKKIGGWWDVLFNSVILIIIVAAMGFLLLKTRDPVSSSPVELDLKAAMVEGEK